MVGGRGAMKASSTMIAICLVIACDSDDPGAPDGTHTQDLGYDKAKTVEDSATPAPGCAAAKKLTLVAGQVKVSGTTKGVTNEFGKSITCGTQDVQAGPQVYYSMDLLASKDYVITLTPAYSRAALYVFGATCTAPAINTDCGSGGKTGAISAGTSAGDAVKILFSPTKDGTYTIAVDGRSESNYGAFALAVQEFPLPGNWKCQKPATPSLSGGKALLKGTTLGGANEFGSKISCGGPKSFAGPQAYYRASLKSGKVYRLTLTPSFPAQLYVFDSTCDPVKIEASCGSKGVTGDVIQVYSSASTSLCHRAWSDTTVVVDSESPSYQGAFTLDWTEVTDAPGNGLCSGAKALPLTAGAVSVKGDTTSAPNQFGAAVTCGVGAAMAGHQVYYTVTLQAGKAYTMGLTPAFGPARLYVFGPACAPASMEAACKSKGKTGAVSTLITKGSTGTLSFSPVKTGSYTIAVDSTSSLAYGPFTLTIK